ncbi:unnamed protein product [Gongylonema pulchrum]|uniref:Ras-GAP domain-containing protein n=1 Tax=Gongylonema pulchrum TaxID=637853 RepID=A0A183E9C5_9BILA|nr:unnamed protein product [Gongylonema pulchrum]
MDNGIIYRYTVTATSDGTKLSSAAKDKSGEVPAVRIKARYQSVQILPMQAYSDLLAFIKRRYLSLCCALEPNLSVKAKEDLATALVRIMHKQQMAKHFLCDLIMSEVDNTLGEFVKTMQQSDKDCEVDPLKMPNINPIALEKNRHQLVAAVETAWCKILNSTDVFPIELREIFDCLRRRLEDIGRLDLADTLISSSIFLRFLCPAILSPSLFSLVSEYPSGRAARNLTLIAKTLQTLANFTKFGGKEHYMDFMNEFVEREWDNMHRYLVRISTLPSDSPRAATGENDWNIPVDVGKEISLLHTYLDEAHTYNSAAQRPAHIHSTVSESHVMLKNNPASHLNTNDDYVLDIALLNDSLAIRQAGLTVQKHRNAQHRNAQRHFMENASCERHSSRRNPYAVADVSAAHERIVAFDASAISNGSHTSAEYNTAASTNIPQSPAYPAGSRHRPPSEETDSDEAHELSVSTRSRHTRPTRKNKRRTTSSADREKPAAVVNACPDTATAPSSSGYQSQNPSSRLVFFFVSFLSS